MFSFGEIDLPFSQLFHILDIITKGSEVHHLCPVSRENVDGNAGGSGVLFTALDI